jgi:CheY-like chemotaxis protein
MNNEPVPLRVLIVDDDDVSRMTLLRVLRSIAGTELFEAEDGEQAWEMIQAGLAVDLCFLDINMPRMNGLQLLGMIKKEPKYATMKVCICSAVRTREVIVEAANLRPDYYLLKPFGKADILEQVRLARNATNIAAPEDVCRKYGLSKEDYLAELGTLMGELRSLEQRNTNCILTQNYLDELLALDHIISAAKKLGAVRILELSKQMAQATKEASELPKETAERSYRNMFQILQDIQKEGTQLEHQVSRITANLSREQEEKARIEESDRLMARYIGKVFQGGRILAPSPASQSKALSIPIRATRLGESPVKTAGAITRRQTFSLSVLDDKALGAIEECRKIGDLSRLLSFHLGEKVNWAPEAAIELLNNEVAAKNAQGVLLLQSVVGPDLDAFLESQKATIHESLAQTAARLNEQEVQDLIADIRERFQRVLGGQLTAQPVLTTLSIGDLEDGTDELWAMPYALLRQSAILFRTAAINPNLEHELTFNTFDHDMFLRAMNVLGDLMAESPDKERAIDELKEIRELEKTSDTYRQKCSRLLAIIRGPNGSGRHSDGFIPPNAAAFRSEEPLHDQPALALANRAQAVDCSVSNRDTEA